MMLHAPGKHAGIGHDVLEHYSNYYEAADSEWRRIGAIAKANNIVALCSAGPHDSVLEVGAGDGAILERLSELGFGRRLYALEISNSGIDSTRKKDIKRLEGCSLFDGYNVPHAENAFDLVILSHVLEHVEHPRELIYAASRAGQYFFVEVPLEDTLRLTADFKADRTGHINFYSIKTIRRLLQTCGLHILGARVTNRPRESFQYTHGRFGILRFLVREYLLRLVPELAPRIFTYHAALVCHRDARAGVVPITGATF